MMAEVYWVRLPEHTDMFSQGYVGVTRNGAKHRFDQHVQTANRTDSVDYHFSRAIRKYGSSLVVSTLLIADEPYCYNIEFKLRPQNYIGWNMAAGGQRPVRNESSYGEEWKEKLREANLGKVHSKKTLDKISSISKKHWSRPEFSQRMREINFESKKPLTPTEGFWKKSGTWRSRHNTAVKRADDIYNFLLDNPLAYNREIADSLGISEKCIPDINTVSKYILGGWNPNEDSGWLEYKNGDISLKDIINVDSLKSRERTAFCTYMDKDKELWSQANKILIFHKDLCMTPFFIEKVLGLKTGRLKWMFRKFKAGWEPLMDSDWVERFGQQEEEYLSGTKYTF